MFNLFKINVAQFYHFINAITFLFFQFDEHKRNSSGGRITAKKKLGKKGIFHSL